VSARLDVLTDAPQGRHTGLPLPYTFNFDRIDNASLVL
jgi:hypothetical protein